MSDDDFGFMDEEEFDDVEDDGIILQYSDEEDDDQNALIENSYYNAKGGMDDDPMESLSGFRMVIEIEESKSEWGFKALKQIVKIHYKLHDYAKMLAAYKELLNYSKKNIIQQTLVEKVINSILELISVKDDVDILRNLYEETLQILSRNQRLWVKVNVELAKLLFEKGEYHTMNRIIAELREEIKGQSSSATQMLETYVMEMQMFMELKNYKKLKETYYKAIGIKSVILHPRIVGIMREIGGKMHMSEREWEKAHEDFFEAFRNFDECGSPKKIQCLKYLLLVNMLMSSEINPFDSQEMKPYESHREIVSMTRLVTAYQKHSIVDFNRALEQTKGDLEDQFMRGFVEDLLKNIRTEALLRMIIPYDTIKMEFLAEELQVTLEQVGELLIELILDGKLDGQIDQINKVLLKRKSVSSRDNADFYKALEAQAKKLLSFQHEMYEYAEY